MTLEKMQEMLNKHGIHVKITDTKFQRGYKARRDYQIKKEEVLFVPLTSKRRRGQAYVLAPRYDTTRYCIRVYFNVYYYMLEELGIYNRFHVKHYGGKYDCKGMDNANS